MSDIDNLADDLGASASPLGLVLVGFGLVGLWFHGSRALAAWELRHRSVAHSEIVMQYNALCPFIEQPPLHKETTMLAACYHKHGSPRDVVQVQRVLRPPAPGPGQLLVQVKAASLNPADWKTGRGGQAGLLHFDWPRVYGFDFSGIVVAVGPKRSEMEQEQHEFRDGDSVFGMISGLPEANRGTLAEYVLVESSICARCPPDTSHVACASLPLVAITATKALQACGLVEGEKSQNENRDGPRVLITGGAGGVGSIAIQLAVKMFNASFVVTTASAGMKTELCHRLGASQVINYRNDNFPQVLANSNEALLFDAIVDCTDEAAKCVPLLKKGGALVSITEGPTQEALVTWFSEAHMDPSKITAGVRPFLFSQAGGALFEFFSGARKLRGECEARGARFAHVIGTGDGQIMAKVAELLANKSIEPVIDRKFTLPEAVSAIEYQALGHTCGKVVITIEDSSEKSMIEPMGSALAQDPILSV